MPYSKITQVLVVFVGHSDLLLLVPFLVSWLTLILKPSTEQLGQSVTELSPCQANNDLKSLPATVLLFQLLRTSYRAINSLSSLQPGVRWIDYRQ